MFVGKDLFGLDAELADETVVIMPSMKAKIFPSSAGSLTSRLGTVEAEQQERLFERFFGLKVNREFLVKVRDLGGLIVGKVLGGRRGKDEPVDVTFAVGAFVLFVQCS